MAVFAICLVSIHSAAYLGLTATDRIACMQDDLNKAVGTRDIPSDVTTAVRNNGGGHWNHSFFWKILTPAESKEADYQVVASDELKKGIEEVWGSLNAFQAKFNEAATAVFGSGWAWLGVDDSGTLVISTTSKIVCSSISFNLVHAAELFANLCTFYKR